MKILPILLACAATTATAQDAEEYVRDNVLAIFYHELGHALIDLQGLPIFGQEEDAADVASVMLMHTLYGEEAAQAMVMSTADVFLAQAEEEAGDIAFWDTHGASEQRYYNAICIFAGGNFEEREEMAELMGLPEGRADWCVIEFEQAMNSWGRVLNEISVDSPSETFVLGNADGDAPIMLNTIREELTAMNQDFGLAKPLPVNVIACGEANAFYDPETQAITMCTEFETQLLEYYETGL